VDRSTTRWPLMQHGLVDEVIVGQPIAPPARARRLHKIGNPTQSPRPPSTTASPSTWPLPASTIDWTLADGCGGKISIEGPAPPGRGDLHFQACLNQRKSDSSCGMSQLRATHPRRHPLASILPLMSPRARWVPGIDHRRGVAEASEAGLRALYARESAGAALAPRSLGALTPRSSRRCRRNTLVRLPAWPPRDESLPRRRGSAE